MKKLFCSFLLGTILAGCTFYGASTKHFSSQVPRLDEAQTDDERTFVGEYNDYLLMVDSFADVWNSNDTLTMRRLYYNQREQQKRIDKLKDRQNIRHSMVEKVIGNVENIRAEIYQKFSPELRNELYVFHEFFDLNMHYYSDLDVRKVVDGKIYANSYGEHYLLVKKPYYEVVDSHLDTTEIIVKQPILDKDIENFRQNYQKFMEYSNPRKQDKRTDIHSPEEDNTDWDAAEIDWCEKCQAKDYSCCPKCKDGERSDCECKCEICMDLGNVNGI